MALLFVDVSPLGLTHTHEHTHRVSTVRPSPTVAKVAMATFHRNGNYN